MVSLSIVIPTHRRPQILKKCLEHIERQTVVDQLEVIIVNDEKCTMDNEQWKMEVQYCEIPPCHQGAARNYGVAKARGDYVLFIGDDIFLAPDACEKHIRTHKDCGLLITDYPRNHQSTNRVLL